MRRRLAGLAVVLCPLTACSDSSDDSAAFTSTSTTTSASSTSLPAPPPSASLAVTVAPYAVAGWWDGRGWVKADGQRPVPLAGGEMYAILGLSGPARTGRGSAPEEGCETDPGTSKVTVSGMDGDDTRPRPVAVFGVPNPRPRPTEVLAPAAAAYRDAAGDVLTERGIDDADADIVQALRTDLEGDGVDEVVVVAERIADRTGLYARAGDYSFVLLRRVVDGTVRTTVVAESVPDLSSEGTPFIYSHRVSAIADLNGDTRLEVALELRQYEGIGLSIHELQPDGSVREVMSVDCGA